MKVDSCFELNKWILRLSVEQISLDQDFNEILQGILGKLKETKNNLKVTRDALLFRQILLHVLSRNTRTGMKSLEYCPEVLREPFVRNLVKEELYTQIFGQMALTIRKAAVIAACDKSSQKCFQTIRRIIRANLNEYLQKTYVSQAVGKENTRMSEEALGWFIVATLYRRFSSMVLPSEHPVGGGLGVLGSCRGGTTDLHHDYDHTHRLNITTPSLATQSRKGSIGNVAAVKCIFSSHKPSHLTHTNQLLHGDESNSTAPTTKNNPVESNMIEDETTGISSNFFSSDVEKLCERLQGYSLPESLRRHIWMFCCLHRAWGDPPPGPSCTSELTRLGVMKGMPIDSFESHAFSKYALANETAARQAIAELASSTVEKLYREGFPLRQSTFTSIDKLSRPCTPATGDVEAASSSIGVSSFLDKAYTHYVSSHLAKSRKSSSVNDQGEVLDEVKSVMSDKTVESMASDFFKQKKPVIPAPPSSAETVLLRRTEVLLRAVYILTGVVSKRGAAIALMILITFPDVSPVSEKILRLFKHINDQCLPSEQMHHSYSILSTAKSTFALLSKEEPVLHAHITKVFNLTLGTAQEESVEIIKAEPVSDTHGHARPPAPAGMLSAGYVLLQPWLETGFVGYVSEFTAMYIWDQCFMFGGRASDWRKVLPVVCVTLLKILKEEFLMARTVKNLKMVMITDSRKIRTKVFSMLMRHRIANSPRKKWFVSPFSDTSLTLDKIRAVVMLQKLGRGRVDRRRVQELINAKQAEKERLEAAERNAVKDWKAEIERQAEEWRAEFIRKKEEEEAREAAVLRETMEYMIQQVMIAGGALPARQQAPKVKSAYQLEWEKLMSHSSGENSDADDVLGRVSGRTSEAGDGKLHGDLEEKMKDEKEKVLLQDITESVVNDLLDNTFTVVDKNEQKRLTDEAKEALDRENEKLRKEKVQQDEITLAKDMERREQTEAVLSSIVSKIEDIDTREKKTMDDAATAHKELIEVVKQKMSDIISQIEKRSQVVGVPEVTDGAGDDEKKNAPSDESANINAPETISKEDDDDDNVAAEVNNDVSAADVISEKFRATLSHVEVDAVTGFFEDQREVIRTLKEEKSRLKAEISKYKKKFIKKRGRVPKWDEKKDEIKRTYEDYQEVSFSLKTYSAKLRDDEDALLKKWQMKKLQKSAEAKGPSNQNAKL